jgi:hypothetical protein
MEKVVAIVFAAYMAANYGVSAGQYWGGYRGQDALLYGSGGVFVVAGIGSYFMLTQIEKENLFSIGFAALMAYLYGTKAGYRYWGAHDDLQAAIYGGGMVFMAGLIVGVLIWRWFVRRIFAEVFGGAARGRLSIKNLVSSVRGNTSRQTPEEIEQEIEDGKVLDYEGLVNRDFNFMDGNRTRTERLRVNFQLQRNTMVMTPREREAAFIFYILKRNGLDAETADRLAFALTWGDGRCQSYGGKISGDNRMLQQNGIKGRHELIAIEAGHRNASLEGAINELFTRLQNMARQANPAPEVVALYERYRTPTVRGSGNTR